MTTWQEDILNLFTTEPKSPARIFEQLESAANTLGFEHLAFGYQAAYPVTRPKIFLLSNYPSDWQLHYAKAGYLAKDPTVLHGRRSQLPLLWSKQTFASNPALWSDAQDHGIRTGWSQSSLEGTGSGSMLTLSRSAEELTDKELESKLTPMRWLVQIAHVLLSRALVNEEREMANHLTPREREVLKWSTDGKSAQDIADILVVSKSAVDFHLKNAIEKLGAPNKTSAVVRAAMSGLLH